MIGILYSLMITGNRSLFLTKCCGVFYCLCDAVIFIKTIVPDRPFLEIITATITTAITISTVSSASPYAPPKPLPDGLNGSGFHAQSPLQGGCLDLGLSRAQGTICNNSSGLNSAANFLSIFSKFLKGSH